MLPDKNTFVSDIKQILENARQKAYSAINLSMVDAYWLVGKRIIEEEEHGKTKAKYGKYLLKNLSIELSSKIGKGFSERNLRAFRQFYLAFPNQQIRHTMCAELSWSHIRRVLRVSNTEARTFYLKEASQNNWSVRTLDRNISTLYYDRLLLSQLKEPVKQEMLENDKNVKHDKFEFIKNPTVLEFLNLPNNKSYTEQHLEKAIIEHLQQFLLELGKGFAFVGRQYYLEVGGDEFFIDLLFYHLELRCYIAIDLKMGKFKPEYAGKMNFYLAVIDDTVKKSYDEPSIGIILCKSKNKVTAEYALRNINRPIGISEYELAKAIPKNLQSQLPTIEDLERELKDIDIQDTDGE